MLFWLGLRLLLPGLADIGGGPDLGSRGGNLAVLSIEEFEADDVAGQHCITGRGDDTRPMGASVGESDKASRRNRPPRHRRRWLQLPGK